MTCQTYQTEKRVQLPHLGAIKRSLILPWQSHHWPVCHLTTGHMQGTNRQSSQLSQRFGPGLSLLLMQPTYTFHPCICLDLLSICLFIHADPALPFASSASEILHHFSAVLWWLCSLNSSSSNISSRSLTWSIISSPETLFVSFLVSFSTSLTSWKLLELCA